MDLVDSYLRAVATELQWLGGPHEIDTLYLGGGTPTQLQPTHLRRLMQLIFRTFRLRDGYELSIEANPDGLSWEHLAVLRQFGVTRLSLGVQSFSAAKLRLLERTHTADEARRVIDMARPSVRSLSLDLIFGVPGETLDDWQRDVSTAVKLGPDHISTYGLTFERGTSFWSRRLRGQLQPVDEQLERAMYELAIDRLTAAGYEHYEVSNFARPGHRCRHNETYWLGRPFFGIGPGAARYVGGRREVNHRSTTTYIKRVLRGQSPVAESETLGPEDAAREQLVFGLRRLEGIDGDRFFAQTGYTIDQLVGSPLERMIAMGLLRWNAGRLQLTREGLLVSDSIWPYFLRS